MTPDDAGNVGPATVGCANAAIDTTTAAASPARLARAPKVKTFPSLCPICSIPSRKRGGPPRRAAERQPPRARTGGTGGARRRVEALKERDGWVGVSPSELPGGSAASGHRSPRQARQSCTIPAPLPRCQDEL